MPKSLSFKEFLVDHGEYRARIVAKRHRYMVEFRLMVPIQHKVRLEEAVVNFPPVFHGYWSENQKWVSVTYARNADITAIARVLTRPGDDQASSKLSHQARDRYPIVAQWEECVRLRDCALRATVTGKLVYTRAELWPMREEAIRELRLVARRTKGGPLNRINNQWPAVEWAETEQV